MWPSLRKSKGTHELCGKLPNGPQHTSTPLQIRVDPKKRATQKRYHLLLLTLAEVSDKSGTLAPVSLFS